MCVLGGAWGYPGGTLYAQRRRRGEGTGGAGRKAGGRGDWDGGSEQDVK